MTKKDLIYIRDLLLKVKDPDGHVKKAIAMCEKDIAHYESMIGQLRKQYEYERSPFS